LTQEEQAVLAAISRGTKRTSRINQEYQQILLRLVTKGVCLQTDQGWQIGSKLWANYIGRQEASRGKLVLNEQSDVISQGLKPIKLAPQESTLLRYMLNHAYKRHPYESIILEIWPGDYDPPTQKQALFQLVRSIRGKIEPNPAEPRYLVNWTDQQDGGYQLFPEGQPF
jgi:DNA-binding response OmpR family regulator